MHKMRVPCTAQSLALLKPVQCHIQDRKDRAQTAVTEHHLGEDSARAGNFGLHLRTTVQCYYTSFVEERRKWQNICFLLLGNKQLTLKVLTSRMRANFLFSRESGAPCLCFFIFLFGAFSCSSKCTNTLFFDLCISWRRNYINTEENLVQKSRDKLKYRQQVKVNRFSYFNVTISCFGSQEVRVNISDIRMSPTIAKTLSHFTKQKGKEMHINIYYMHCVYPPYITE